MRCQYVRHNSHLDLKVACLVLSPSRILFGPPYLPKKTLIICSRGRILALRGFVQRVTNSSTATTGTDFDLLPSNHTELI